MTALLDVNVLIALLDEMHVHHLAAHEWFEAGAHRAWATCPITENGLVRVLSSPGYPGNGTTLAGAVAVLRRLRTVGGHEFWSDDASLCDPGGFRFEHVSGPRQVTDVYLLGLAVRNGGFLATFDRGISPRAVPGATQRHLVRIR